MRWAPRTFDTAIPYEYRIDGRVRAALAAPEVRRILMELLSQIQRCRSLDYPATEVASCHGAVLTKAVLRKIEQKHEQLKSVRRRLFECRISMIQSRRRYVAKLESSMRATVLTRHRSALSASRRHLERLGSAWWPDAGDRALSEWHHMSPRIRFNPDMGRDDRKLIEKWERPWHEDVRGWYERVASARRAEKSAKEYFEQVSDDVRDVSIQQLDPENQDWPSHDLLVDDKPVDVKNVRHSHGGYRVSDQPKRTRFREQVAVLGVVSESSGGREQTVVGEADGHTLEQLGHVVEGFCKFLELPLVWRRMPTWKAGMGPWQMEYRPQHYRQGASGGVRFIDPDYQGLVESVRRAEDLEFLLGPVPPWIRGIASFHCGLFSESGGVTDALAEWHRLSAHVPSAASRPALFLFVLLFLLSVVKRGSWKPNETREKLIDALFVNDTDLAREHPVGLHDPLRTIHTFIGTLDKLIVKNKELLLQIEELRLRGVGVLRGRLSAKEFTLLAYCGKCKKAPLWAP